MPKLTVTEKKALAKKEVREFTDSYIMWKETPFNPTNLMIVVGVYCTWRDYPNTGIVEVYLHKD